MLGDVPLSDPSDGAMPLQRSRLRRVQLIVTTFQTPQTGLCLCNVSRSLASKLAVVSSLAIT